MIERVWTVLAGGLVGVAGVGGWAAASPQEPEPAKPAPTASSGQPGEIATADELLTRLETADKDIRSLEAEILYDRLFDLDNSRQIRKGMLDYVDSKAKGDDGKPAPGSRKFAIQFNRLKVGAEPWRPEDKIMVFDGQWLIEKMPKDKQMIKRQVVEAGKQFDPLKIGEGPFPIPIGQKKDDILKRFDAELLPVDKDLKGNEEGDTAILKEFVTKAKAYQLKLTPKPGPEAQFKEVRLWYAPDASGTLLPVMARTINQQDDVSIVELVKVKVNQPVPSVALDTEAPAGWTVSIEKLGPENRR